MSLPLSVFLHGGIILLLSGFLGNWGMHKVQELEVEAASIEVYVDMVEPVPVIEHPDDVEDIPEENRGDISSVAPQKKVKPAQKKQSIQAAPSKAVDRMGIVLVDRYADLVREHLTRFKFYPVRARQNREEGRVVVGFSVDRSGQAGDVRIISTSFSHALDQAALDAVRKATPFPRPPDEMSAHDRAFKVPLVYHLRQ